MLIIAFLFIQFLFIASPHHASGLQNVFINVPLTNSSKQSFATTLNAIDESTTHELSAGLFYGGVTSVQVDIQIDSKVIQSGVLREGDKLLFYIPEASSGQILAVFVQISTGPQTGDAVVTIRNSNGPSVCTDTYTTSKFLCLNLHLKEF